MLTQVTMLFSSSRRTVCTPCLLFLRKIEILLFSTKFFKNFDFPKNDKLENTVAYLPVYKSAVFFRFLVSIDITFAQGQEED